MSLKEKLFGALRVKPYKATSPSKPDVLLLSGEGVEAWAHRAIQDQVSRGFGPVHVLFEPSTNGFLVAFYPDGQVWVDASAELRAAVKEYYEPSSIKITDDFDDFDDGE